MLLKWLELVISKVANQGQEALMLMLNLAASYIQLFPGPEISLPKLIGCGDGWAEEKKLLSSRYKWEAQESEDYQTATPF